MANKNVVLFLNNSALYLGHVKRDKAGRITDGWVINGHWNVRIRGDKEKTCGFTITSYEEVEVLRNGDYNDVIEAARKRRHA